MLMRLMKQRRRKTNRRCFERLENWIFEKEEEERKKIAPDNKTAQIQQRFPKNSRAMSNVWDRFNLI